MDLLRTASSHLGCKLRVNVDLPRTVGRLESFRPGRNDSFSSFGRLWTLRVHPACHDCRVCTEREPLSGVIWTFRVRRISDLPRTPPVCLLEPHRGSPSRTDLPRTLGQNQLLAFSSNACETGQYPKTLRVRQSECSAYTKRTFRVQSMDPPRISTRPSEYALIGSKRSMCLKRNMWLAGG